MASVEPVDELQERVARCVEERLGPILREVNRLDDLLSTETIERTLLGEQLLALRTQGGNAQGASTQRIKLMEPERFKDKPGSNILQWLDCMERYLTAGQVAEEEKIQVAWTYLEPRVAQHWQTLAKELEASGQDNRLWKNFRQTLIRAYGNVLPEQVARNKLWNLTQKGSVEAYATEFQLLCAQIINLELSVGDKIDRFVRGLKPEIRERVVVDPFNEGGRWEDFKRLLTYAVAMDATIEQSCPKEMRKNPPKFSGPIRKDKARGKAMTLSNGKSLDFYKANALRREGKCFLCEQKGHQAKDCTGEKNDGGAPSEKLKFKTKKDF
jgi:hypothetical protein